MLKPKLKYFNKYNRKDQLLRAVKCALVNDKFFSRSTMKFFGRQRFWIIDSDNGPLLRIKFLEKCPRVSHYAINPETLELTSTNQGEAL